MHEGERVVIVSPHPDDEILGCGGLISRLNSKNKELFIIFLTKGENSTTEIDKEDLISERMRLTFQAAGIVGQPYSNIHYLNFEDGRVGEQDEENERLSSLINTIRPDTVYVTHRLEGWNDHYMAFELTREIVKESEIRLFEYCVWLWYKTQLKDLLKIGIKNVHSIKLSAKENSDKRAAIAVYLDTKNDKGVSYSGALPRFLREYSSKERELYFLVNKSI